MEEPSKGNPPSNWTEVFLKTYSETGNISHSARKAQVTRQAVYARRDIDDAFRSAMVEAKEQANAALEAEALRRATKGTLKPIFYQGAKCGAVREFSDTLLIVLLKANMPEKYRENARIEHAGVPGSPIAVAVEHDFSKLSAGELTELYRAAISPPDEV